MDNFIATLIGYAIGFAIIILVGIPILLKKIESDHKKELCNSPVVLNFKKFVEDENEKLRKQ